MSDSSPPVDDAPPVVCEFEVEPDGLVLEEALARYPDVTAEYELLVPTTVEPLAYLWVTDGEGVPPGFLDAVAADPQVADVHAAESLATGTLCYLDWSPREGSLFEWLTGLRDGAALLEATATADGWRLKVRFLSRDLLGAFRDLVEERARGFDLRRLFEVTDPKLGQYDLTRKQREAMLRTLEMGYYRIPRETTLDAVADSLGISTKALSERLRRGQTNLVANTLAVGGPSGVGLADG